LGQPVLVGEAVGRRVQVARDPDDVVDAHWMIGCAGRGISHRFPPRCTTRSGAKRSVTRTSPGFRGGYGRPSYFSLRASITARPSSSVADSRTAWMKTYSYWSSALAIRSVARPVRLTFSGHRRPWAELRTTWSPSTSAQTSVEWIEPFSFSVETGQKLRALMSSRP